MAATLTTQGGRDPLPKLEPSLACIVAPATVPEFRDRYWKQEVFFCPGSAARLQPVLRELGSTDIAKLLWQSQNYVILGRQASETPAGRLSMAAALEAYEKRGATLYFRMKSDWPLTKWTAALAEELGEPPLGVTSFFAVRGENGTRPHLDWNDNFTIQILGTKRWLVAPNGFVTHPITNWMMGDPPPPFARSTQLPNEMPAETQEYRLTPGSVLYVPRGFLHHVTALDTEDSLSLNMSLPPTPWAVVLCGLLSNRLLEDPEFREALRGAFGTGWGREKVLQLLPDKLTALSRHADEIGTDLRAIMQDPAKLREFLVKRTHPRY